MESSVYDGFKTAVVTSLIKKATHPADDLKNYHPVSGISFNIHVHNLDNLYQSAQKTGHSTETALLSIKNEVHLSLLRGEPTALILLDL